MNARKLALEAIDKIIEKGAYSNIIVNEYLSKYELTPEDKNLFTNLVYGTLQHQLTIEYYLEPYLKKKPKHYIYNLLLMSVYQIVFLNIPYYAVLDESVKIAKLKDFKLGTFVNAVLRNFLRKPIRDIEEIKMDGDNLKYLSIKYSHPLWLVAFLLKDYPIDVVEEILKENNNVKLDAIRVNTLKVTKEEIINKLKELDIEYQDIDIVKNGLIVKETLVNTDLFKNGLITVQDISSQMVAEVANPKPGTNVIDLCAAPGGKTAHLSSIMNNQGTIYACDIYPHKIKLMEGLFKRLGVKNVKPQQIDARLVKEYVKPKSFDCVLADVPCSGLGVISHKVDLKYRIDLESIDEIIALQKSILDNIYDLVKPNGALVYSTCTINKDENENQIKDFLKEHSDFEIEYEKQILPQDYHTDGFYICKLRRK